MNFSEYPHRRYNPLTKEWVKISPHRTNRPWQGQSETTDITGGKPYDPECYLCPGNQRAKGIRNPEYADVYSFDNDFPALLPDTPDLSISEELFKAKSEKGICKVLCYSAQHDLNFARLSLGQIEKIICQWQKEYEELSQKPEINHVQIFENHGAVMGCSNPHPHGQIWAENLIPNEIRKEDNSQREYFAANKKNLLQEYVSQEIRKQERIVVQNESFAAVVPFWAVWPFETLVVPIGNVLCVNDLNKKQISDLAQILKKLTAKYDNLFKTDFPYSMGIHQALCNDDDQSHWTMHMHFYPPLLRSASVKKFMVGYEMMAMPQRDLTAETAAKILKELSDIHYLEQQ